MPMASNVACSGDNEAISGAKHLPEEMAWINQEL
jgi:hypothetical protein